MLSSYVSRESLGEKAVKFPRFAPAYDPFVTAETLQSIISEIEFGDREISNLYLAPLSSKPMTIGFAALLSSRTEWYIDKYDSPFCGIVFESFSIWNRPYMDISH